MAIGKAVVPLRAMSKGTLSNVGAVANLCKIIIRRDRRIATVIGVTKRESLGN